MQYIVSIGSRVWLFTILVVVFLSIFYLGAVTSLPPTHPIIKFLSALPLGALKTMKQMTNQPSTSILGGNALAGIPSWVEYGKILINLVILGITGLGEILFKLCTFIPYLSPLWTILGGVLTFLQFSGWVYFFYCIILRRC